MATTYYADIQKLYVAYFNRPADPAGLAFWEGVIERSNGSTAAVSQAFSSSDEYKAAYGNLNAYGVVNAVYQNLFGRAPDAAGLQFWANGLINGTFTVAQAVTTIAAGAQGDDLKTFNNRVTAATEFTKALDTTAELIGYDGPQANAAAKTFLSGITTDDSLKAAITTDALNNAINTVITAGQNSSGQVFTLTDGIDALVGTNGNDVFNADIANMGGFDTINGGAGNDTVSIFSTGAIAAGAIAGTGTVITNVENLSIRNSAATSLNAGDTGAFKTVTVATANGTDANVAVAGGTATTTVNVSGGGTGTVGISGANVTTAGLTSSGAATVTADKLTTLNLASQTADVTVTAAAATRALTINANGVGSSTTAANVSDATATSITLNGTGSASNIALTATAATTLAINSGAGVTLSGSAAAATTLTVTGAGKTTLNGLTAGALTSVDASAATGAVDMGTLGTKVVTVKGGAGNDKLTLTATDKVTIDTGAGGDVVTLNSALAAGSTINLGAGNDKLVKGASGSVLANTSTATTVIDGGEGIDTLAAGFITAGNATQFKNFEILGLDASTLDVSLATSNTFTGLELLAGGGTYTNVTNTQGLAVNTAGVTGTTTLTFSNVTGSADAYTVTFGATAAATSTATSPTAVAAGTVSIEGIETVNVVSKAASGFAANSIVLKDAAAQTVTVTGDQALNLSFATGFGGTTDKGVTTIDASAATAAVTINTTNVTAASAGLTIKGGSGNDMITLGASATVDGGAGNDTIKTGAFSSTLTGGAGKDVFDVSLAVSSGTAATNTIVTTITDFGAGDTIKLSGASDTFVSTKVDVSSATTLAAALNLAAAGTTVGAVTWFTYGSNTYIVEDNNAGTALAAGDLVVKLTGNIDLSHSTIATGTGVLTYA